jgi:multidrug resistance efflux pump
MRHFPELIEAFVRSWRVRVTLACALILISSWAFFPHIVYRIAPVAFVNAELMRVTAPIPGRLTQDLPRKGDTIDSSMTINLVNSLSPDRRHLLDLEQQSAVAKDRAGLARRQLDEISAADRELEDRTHNYQGAMVDRLNKEIVEAEAEKRGCLAEMAQRRQIDDRMSELVKSGYMSQIRSAETAATAEANAARCAVADAKSERIKVELSAAQKKVFLRDGANDAPYSQQQRDRLALRRQDLETDMLQQRSRALQIEAEIKEERSRLERISHSDLTLPPNHVVWSVSASPGSSVTEGQTILDLADCAHRFVVVELPERDFEMVKAGDSPSVRLIGSSDWRLGKVRQVLGSAARTDDRLLAAQIPRVAASNIAVEVELPQDQGGDDRSFCNVGRMAEVRFNRSGLAFLNWFKAAQPATNSDLKRQAFILRPSVE